MALWVLLGKFMRILWEDDALLLFLYFWDFIMG